MTEPIRVGAVVLAYNSSADLPACLDGLLRQEGVDLRLFLVDNASRPEERARTTALLHERHPGAPVLPQAEATPERLSGLRAALVLADRNGGYSAGNNIGARLAVGLGCDAVLILNPDVRIEDPTCVATLAAALLADASCAAAGPRIFSLAGRDENPQREPEFWEELLWVRQFGPRVLRPRPWVVPVAGPVPVPAEKLHGSCLLLRSGFLEATDYLDENVFLYCEEPILAARVRRAGLRMLAVPSARVLHAHVAGAKGNPSRRMLQMIRSRLYYLETYSGYGRLRLAALRASYAALRALHAARARRADAASPGAR